MDVRVGCAGWSIPKVHAALFKPDGSHLQRYGVRFRAVEINSSFHRPHRPSTYARWAASVPKDFRFAVKIPKEVTHTRRLVETADLLDSFLPAATALGENIGPLLVQLPPSLRFVPVVAGSFFEMLRARFTGDLACEPRHESWFRSPASRLLTSFRVGRVAPTRL